MEQSYIQRYKIVTVFSWNGGRSRSNNARVTLSSEDASIDISLFYKCWAVSLRPSLLLQITINNWIKEFYKTIL